MVSLKIRGLKLLRQIPIIFIIFLIGFKLEAQSIIELNSLTEIQSVSSDLEIYIDKNANKDIHFIINNKDKLPYLKSDIKVPSFGFTSSAIWIRFVVNNSIGEDAFLQISPSILNDIRLFTISPNGTINSTQNGSLYKKNERKIQSKNFIFKLSKNTNTYYIRIKTNTRLFFKLYIGSYRAISNENRKDDLVFGIFLGLLLTIFVYNLFLYITNKEKIYLYYILHLINILIFALYVDGYGIQYIWEDFPDINKYFISIMSLGFIFPVIFSALFLETKQKTPQLHILFKISIYIFILIAGIDVLGLHKTSGVLLNFAGFIIALIVLITAIKITMMKFKPAGIFLLAWVIYIIGTLVQVLQGINLIPSSTITSNSIQIGNVAEIILLSFAIGFKINNYKEEKNNSLKREALTIKENNTLTSKEQERLENYANKQSTIIQLTNEKLKKRQIELENQRKSIDSKNFEFSEKNELLEKKKNIIEQKNKQFINNKKELEIEIDKRTKDLKIASIKAEESDRLKTSFLKNVSHEIRTPMNAIAGFSSLLYQIDWKDKRFQEFIQIVDKNTDKLLNLIDNIVDLSKLQSGSLKLIDVKFNPSKLFNALLDEFSDKLKEKRKLYVSMRLKITKAENIRIKTDYNRLWQIIYHLLDNAIKYTERGYVEFGYDCNFENNKFYIFVRDTGQGISEAQLKIIFNRFRKIEYDESKFYSGTGLGLALVKELSDKMNANIDIISFTKENCPDDRIQGTYFQIDFDNIIEL